MKCNISLKIIFVFTLFLIPIFHFCREDEYKPSYLKSSFVEIRNNYIPEEPTNGVQSTVQRGVALQRQSNKKTDKYYNFYLQSDIVELSMNYENSDQMVTRQGGSLKGTVLINNGNGFNGWAGRIEVTKPVSRPWVEFVGFKPENYSDEGLEEKGSSEKAEPVFGKPYFQVGRKRDFLIAVNYDTQFWFNTIRVVFNGDNGVISGETEKSIMPLTSTTTLNLSLSGTSSSAYEGSDSLSFYIGKMLVGKLPITVFKLINVEWEENYSGQLMANKDSEGNLMPGGGLKVYGDKDNPEDGDEFAMVKVKAQISPPVEGVPVYFKVFDVDDPSSNEAPVDDESFENDNRAGGENHDNPTFYTTLKNDSSATDLEGTILAKFSYIDLKRNKRGYPGDNFRIACDLLDPGRLSKWKAIKDDGEQSGIGWNGSKDRRISQEFMTDLLTVWRRLNIEWDFMKPPWEATVEGELNYIDGKVTAIEPIANDESSCKYVLDSNFVDGIAEDASDRLDSTPIGNGRFENGSIFLNLIEIGMGTLIYGNGADYVVGAQPSCSLKVPDGQGNYIDVDANVISFGGTQMVVKSTEDISSAKKEITLGDTTYQISSLSRNPSNQNQWILTFSYPIQISYRLLDDDLEDLERQRMKSFRDEQMVYLKKAFAKAYIEPRLIEIQNNTEPPFLRNVKSDPDCYLSAFSNYFDTGKKGNLTNNYWGAYIANAYQPTTAILYQDAKNKSGDSDPDDENLIRGQSFKAYSALYIEVVTEGERRFSRNPIYLTAHEAAHQFDCVDRYNIAYPAPIKENGIMGGYIDFDDAFSSFIPADISILRRNLPNALKTK
jgi:hypothetical protein